MNSTSWFIVLSSNVTGSDFKPSHTTAIVLFIIAGIAAVVALTIWVRESLPEWREKRKKAKAYRELLKQIRKQYGDY